MSDEINATGSSRTLREDPEKTLFNESDAESMVKPSGEVPADEAVQEEPAKRSPLRSGWKAVTIGGISGIMLGVAPFAFGNQDGKETVEDAPAAPADLEPGSPVQEPVQVPVGKVRNLDDMSFGQAFASARAELGPGEVFEWRGGLYTTDTVEEWEAAHPLNDDVIVAESDDASVEFFGAEMDGIQDGVLVDVEVDGEDGLDEDVYVAELDDDDEVEIIDVDTVQGDDEEILVGTLSDDGDEAHLVDTDGDGSFDAIAADFDGDGSITGDELFMLRGLEPGLPGFDLDDPGLAPDPSSDMDF